jgi:hypothetical protein
MYKLAQINVGRMLAPLGAPVMAGFVAQLEAVNAVADARPGFAGRLQRQEGDATSVRVFDDPTLLVNVSVWSSPDALRDYVYRSGHAPGGGTVRGGSRG